MQNLRYQVADICELPFPDSSFDVAGSHGSLIVKSRAKALRKLHHPSSAKKPKDFLE